MAEARINLLGWERTDIKETAAITSEQPKQLPHACCRLCRLPQRWCICAFAPAANLRSSLTLLVHSIEWRKTSNTGHLIRSITPDWRVLVHGRPHQRLTEKDFFWNEKKPYVLFPGRGARSITAIPESERRQGIHLIIPDGNWRQSSHMLKRIEPLSGVPAIMLDEAAPTHRRMRVNISPERMSTFEAVVLAMAELSQFEGDLHATERLLHFFRLYADRMLMLRGRLRAADTEQPMEAPGALPS